MVCTKCGKSIEKGQKCCGFCGAEVVSAEPRYDKKRIIFLSVVSAFAVLFILAVVIFMCMDYTPSQSSYTTVIDKGLHAIQEIDIDEYMELLPEDYINYTLKENESYTKYDDMVLDYEDKLWEINRTNKKEYGTDFKIIYEIENEVHYREDEDLLKLTEEFNNRYNGKSQITEAVQAVISTEIKSSTAEGSHETVERCFIKIDETWYLDIDGITREILS